jgi:hypothetical protein
MFTKMAAPQPIGPGGGAPLQLIIARIAAKSKKNRARDAGTAGKDD